MYNYDNYYYSLFVTEYEKMYFSKSKTYRLQNNISPACHVWYKS